MAAGSGWWQDMWGAFSSLSRPAVAAMRGGLVGCPWLPSSTADARLHVHADAAGTAWWELAGPAALWLACEEAKSARATLGRRRIGMMPELKVRSARVVAATGDDLATAVAVRHSTPHHVAFASTSGVFDRSARGVILSCPMQDPAVVERSCCDAQALSVLVPSTSTSVPVDSVAPWMRPADLAAAPWSSTRRYVRPAVSAGSLAIATAASRAQMDATGRLGASHLSGSSDGSALGSEAASYGGPSALRHAEIPAVPPLPRGSLPSVRVFDMRASHRARCVATVSATVGSASAIACAPGDRALIVGGSRGDLGLFDLRAMCLVHHHGAGKDCHTRGIRALTVDPSGSFVASGGGDGSVRLWGVPSLKDIGSLPGLFAERTFVGHKLGDGMVSRAGVTGLVLTEDSLFASGTGGFVYALPKRWV
ncbi:hypothetical protein FNF28_05211 [Cafeteria roenbergensis]|uniref:Uncharacterized protein n=1 Tax=Cafeteria roenbergensis TaxID=33653 RepID=A0A5A8D934_CAFRO|nr:hypothetical protein FNF28_05211 [Cafeteria roenbergensis]